MAERKYEEGSGDAQREAERDLDEARLAWRDWIEEHGGAAVRNHRADLGGFELRLAARWHEALHLLELTYVLGLDLAGEAKRRSFAPEDGDLETDQPLSSVLFRLHAQSLRVGSEIIALLRAGHSAGALSRWRTLHETVTVLLFIADHGGEVAELYLSHEAVQVFQAAREYNGCAEALGAEPFADEELASIQARADRLLALHGRAFKNDYGWAHDALQRGGARKPSLTTMEDAVGRGHLRPYVRMASHSIHANPKALSSQPGLLDPGSVLLVGPSNYGLSIPGQLTSNALALSTIYLVKHVGDLDLIAAGGELLELSKRASAAFVETQRELVEEERGSADTG